MRLRFSGARPAGRPACAGIPVAAFSGPDSHSDSRPKRDIHAIGDQADPIDEVAARFEDSFGHLMRRADGGNRVQQRIVDQIAHSVPLALSGHGEQRLVNVSPVHAFQNGQVGRGRGIEADLAPGRGGGLFDRGGIGPGCHDDLAGHLDLRPRAAADGEPASKRGQAVLAEGAPGMEWVDDVAIAHLAGDLHHKRPDARQEHARDAVGIGFGGEGGRHQRMPVKLALEGQFLSTLPARPDGVQGLDEFPHAGGRPGPRHAIAPFDVRLYLRAQAKNQPPPRHQLQIVGRVGQRQRAAGKSDGDGRHELQIFGVLGGDGEGKERIVLAFEGVNAGKALPLGGGGECRGFQRVLDEHGHIELHRGAPV